MQPSVETDAGESAQQSDGKFLYINQSDFMSKQRHSIETVEASDGKSGAIFYGNLMNRINKDSIRISQTFEPTTMVETPAPRSVTAHSVTRPAFQCRKHSK